MAIRRYRPRIDLIKSMTFVVLLIGGFFLVKYVIVPNDNVSPPTSTSGSLSIATDHSSYPGAASIQVQVTNHLSVPIYAQDGAANCSIFTLELLQGSTWENVTTGWRHCGSWCSGTVPPSFKPSVVEIAPSHTYRATITSTRGDGSIPPLAPGTYRFQLTYAAQASEVHARTHLQSTTSAALQIYTAGGLNDGGSRCLAA
jgi:hypothetical protein